MIEHFTIVNDDADSRIDIVDDVAETFEATTTTIKYNISGDDTNINISIP